MEIELLRLEKELDTPGKLINLIPPNGDTKVLISKSQIGGLIDHTLLKPFETREAIQQICTEVSGYNFRLP